MIRLTDVTKSFAGPRPRTVLDRVSLDVPRGQLAAILGESGAGKSTLLNVIAGLETADAGMVIVGNVDLAGLDDDARTAFRREHVGFVFQAFHVLPYLSVADNVALPLKLAGRRDPTVAERVGAMLAAVGLADRAASMPRELSGGELQRIAIARALVHRPQVVLADEPTGNLDRKTAMQVFDLMLERNAEEGTALVIVTHDTELAARADRTLHLVDGKLT